MHKNSLKFDAVTNELSKITDKLSQATTANLLSKIISIYFSNNTSFN